MRNLTWCLSALLILSSCGTIYIPQILPEARGVGRSAGQENLRVKIIPLTKSSLQLANKDPYIRRVVDASDLTKPAKLVSVKEAIDEKLPSFVKPPLYRLGVGDVLKIFQSKTIVGINQDPFETENSSVSYGQEISERIIPISADGSVSLIGTGRIILAGLTQTEAEDRIYESLVNSQQDPNFELSIFKFNSKKIYLVIMGSNQGKTIALPFTDSPIFLHQVLAKQSSLGNIDFGTSLKINKGEDSLVILKRNDTSYRLSLNKVIQDSQKIPLWPEDKIFVEPLPYRAERAILAGEVAQQKLIELSAFERPSLAEALYRGGGVFVTGSSDTSQIYVIRQKQEELSAYHLDASNPSRLSLATKFELRPNDIIYVAPQSVTNYNRALVQIFSAYAITNDASLAVNN